MATATPQSSLSTAASANSEALAAYNANAPKRNTLGSFEEWAGLLAKSLENQTPDNPMDTNQMAQQFAMFGQVQALMGIDKKLDAFLDNQKAGQALALSSQIGKIAEIQSSSFYYGPVAQNSEVSFTAPPGPTTAKAMIYNDQGRLVGVQDFDLSENKSHTQKTFYWHGKGLRDELNPPGIYTAEIKFFDKEGKIFKDQKGSPLKAATFIKGIVTGADADQGSPTVSLNGIKAPLKNIRSFQGNTAQPDKPTEPPVLPGDSKKLESIKTQTLNILNEEN